MKTEHNGIEITYVEGDNRWHFELRGRTRSADSLAKAKEAIEKEPKEKRAQVFPRFEAWKMSYKGFSKVTVTSVANDDSYRGQVFWIVGADGKGKEYASSLFPTNEHNNDVVEKINAIEKERDALDKKIVELKKTLRLATIPAELK